MKMRGINVREVETIVERLCVEANTVLREDVKDAFRRLLKKEKNSVVKKMLNVLIENARLAEEKKLAICQDTGIVTVFIDIGDRVALEGKLSLREAVNNGVKKAYHKNYFRKSVVADPIDRKNTGTNTPSFLHIDIVKGDKLKISVMPKGFGSENKGRIGMLNPTCTKDEIVDFCVDTVRKAGPDACPPYVLGIGLGGTMDESALQAKKALLRPINVPSEKPHIAELEWDIKKKANALKIGIMGLGGGGTVIGVNINAVPTHIAGFPVAVNISCHALRSASAVL